MQMNSPLSLDDVLNALPRYKRQGGAYRAPCPAHRGKDFNLAVLEKQDGYVVLTCHSRGCSRREILSALGLSEAGGMPSSEGVMGSLPSSDGPEAVYPYHDADGTLLFEVCRFPGKDFRQRTPDGTWGIRGVKRVPYRLPEVLEGVSLGKRIYIVEGEKDADAIRAIGGRATCNMGGAGKWQDEFSDYLAGAHVYIVADKDQVGREHAEAVERSVARKAKSVRILQAKVGKDVSDHLAGGYTLNDLEPYKPHTGLVTVRASAVRSESVRWIPGFENQLAYGQLSGLWGMPGVNKSTYACLVAASLTRRGQAVMFISAEDSPSVLKGRLLAHGGNQDLLYFAHMRREGMDGGLVLLPQDVPFLERVVDRDDIKLVVIDPIQAHFSADVNANVDHLVRLALSPLAKMGERQGCAILIISHLTKDRFSVDPMLRCGGSIGIPGIARTCLLMGRHPDSRHARVVVGFKNNHGPPYEGQSYAIELSAVPGYDDPPIRLSERQFRRVTPEAVLWKTRGGGDEEQT